MNPSGKPFKCGLVSDDGTAKVVEPAVCSLDLVASPISATGSSVLRWRFLATVAMRADQCNAAFFLQSLAQLVAIGGAIVNQMLRHVARDLQPVQRRFNQLDFVVVGSCKIDGDRSSVRVNNVNFL